MLMSEGKPQVGVLNQGKVIRSVIDFGVAARCGEFSLCAPTISPMVACSKVPSVAEFGVGF